MKLALYGGTFDPIHHGHLILAREAREQLELDRIVFIPAAQSPFKPHIRPTASAVRLAMVAAAIEGEPGFELDGSEIARGGVSFTIDTVLAAQARWPGAELWWFIGEDHLQQLPTWHRYEELRNLVQFAVFTRDAGNQTAHPFPRILRQVDISATEVRTRVAQGRSIRYLVPEAVRELIEEHGLYRPNH